MQIPSLGTTKDSQICHTQTYISVVGIGTLTKSSTMKSMDYKSINGIRTGNMSQFGLAVRRQAGKRRDLSSNPLQLSFFFKGCGLWTPSCDFVPHNYETLKWLSSLPTLMQ